MIAREDIQGLMRREFSRPVLSAFLDMSVTADNKRTHQLFLNKRRSEISELDSDRAGAHREALGEAFERIERWIQDEFDETNKGVALFIEVGGEWMEAFQIPVPVPNRLVIGEEPAIGTLVQVLERHRHHGVVLVDREHVRMISVQLGVPIREHRVEGEPYPAPHDVQRGGYSQKDYQKRKAEEVRHFFREFGKEVDEFVRRYRPDDLVLVGTDENVKAFLDHLSEPARQKVVHTAPGRVDAPTSEILQRLTPFFRMQEEKTKSELVDLLRDRVRNRHLATAGFHDTVVQLQQGKVDTLILARDAERDGARCTSCGFYLAHPDTQCPYCGGRTRDGVDLVEAIVRLAEEQEVPIEFVARDAIADLNDVGALLKFE